LGRSSIGVDFNDILPGFEDDGSSRQALFERLWQCRVELTGGAGNPNQAEP